MPRERVTKGAKCRKKKDVEIENDKHTKRYAVSTRQRNRDKVKQAHKRRAGRSFSSIKYIHSLVSLIYL